MCNKLPTHRSNGNPLVWGVRVYGDKISKDYHTTRGSQCIYHSSCSGYAKQSVKESGLRGIPRALARLSRCRPERGAKLLSGLVNSAVNSPDSSLQDVFHSNSPEVESEFLEFRESLLNSARELATGNSAKGVELYQKSAAKFFNTVHFTTADPLPGKKAKHQYKLYRKRQARDLEKADYGVVGNALRAASAWVGGVAGAMVGGVAGATIGAVVGTQDGWAAGSGKASERQAKLEARYGEGTQSGSPQLTGRVEKLRGVVQSSIGQNFLSQSISSVIGGAVGLVTGLAGGTALTGKVGFRLGKVLGRNLTDGALSKILSSNSTVVVEKAEKKEPVWKHQELNEKDTEALAQSLWHTYTR